jgi:hypothetical protein
VCGNKSTLNSVLVGMQYVKALLLKVSVSVWN